MTIRARCLLLPCKAPIPSGVIRESCGQPGPAKQTEKPGWSDSTAWVWLSRTLLLTVVIGFNSAASAIVVQVLPHHFRVIEYTADSESAQAACIEFAVSLGYTAGRCHHGQANDHPGADAMWQAGWLRDPSIVSPDFRFYLGDFVYGIPNPKGLGPPEVCVGNPINIGNGNKFQVETDYAKTDTSPLEFKRYYNSATSVFDARLGRKWRHSYDRSIVAQSLNGNQAATVLRQDGRQYFFTFNAALGSWHSEADVVLRLSRLADPSGNPIGWELVSPDDDRELYDASGRLLSLAGREGHLYTLTYDRSGRLSRISDPKDRTLDIGYDDEGRIETLLGPGGISITYNYDGNDNLSDVTYPGEKQRIYLYEKPSFPHALTGLMDENNVRFASWLYDSKGRSVASEHFNGVDAHVVDYGSGGPNMAEVTVVDSLDAERVYTFEMLHGVPRNTGQSQPSGTGCGFATSARVHDANGNIESATDFNDVTTRRSHNGRNLEVYRIEAQGEDDSPDEAFSKERKIETDWSSKFRVPVEQRTFSCQAPETTEQPCGVAMSARWKLESVARYTLNERGQLAAHCEVDPEAGTSALSYVCGEDHVPPAGVRQTLLAYCEQADVDSQNSTCPILGLPKEINGPREDVSDVTSYFYHPATDESGCDDGGPCHRRGDLWRAVNALGQVTENLRYDRAGRLARQRATEGTLTDFEYHPRGWLARRIVRARGDGLPDVGDATTQLDYTPTGLLEQVTQADGDYTRYSYDEAHRLDDISDALGNHIVYTLDPAGNRIREEISDAGSVLRRRLAREHDVLGRMVRERDAMVDAANPNGRLVAEHEYDGNANRTRTIDGLGHQTDHEYDPLNRLVESLDALTPRGNTQFGYDARDNLTRVTDPKGLVTEYVYDGLSNLRELRSPDTGTTVYLSDDAGNRIQQTDARGVVTQYDYDALNRLDAISYPSDPSYNVTFTYDEPFPECGLAAVHGKGRLTHVIDPSGTTLFCYDQRGNVTGRLWNDGIGDPLVTQYRYSGSDRLESVTYPSGREVEWLRDDAGRIETVRIRPNAGTPWQTLVASVSYYPFGPISALDFGNGRSLTKSYDTNYAISAVASSDADGLGLGFEVDVLGQIRVITPQPGGTGDFERRYDYDPVGRLTEVRDANQALIEGYAYDATGNRLQKQTATGTESYIYPPTSHRLSSAGLDTRLYDNVGNLNSLLLGPSSTTYDYGPNNRYRGLSLNQAIAAEYTHNSQGERSCKWVAGQPTRFVYGPVGQLLGEYNADGKALAEYVYLDSLPVAAVIGSRTVLVETDHLGTPRAVVDFNANEVLWRWPLTGSAFGEHAADEDTEGDGKPLVFPLRLPGQYLDAESGLHYNYFRNFEPGTGRYIEPDPLGLRAGPSLYSYVLGNPLGFFDPWGLLRVCYGTSRPRYELDLVNGGLVQDGWHPYFDQSCASVPEPCTYSSCDHCYRAWNRCSLVADSDPAGLAIGMLGGGIGFMIKRPVLQLCAGAVASWGLTNAGLSSTSIRRWCDSSLRECLRECDTCRDY